MGLTLQTTDGADRVVPQGEIQSEFESRANMRQTRGFARYFSYVRGLERGLIITIPIYWDIGIIQM